MERNREDIMAGRVRELGTAIRAKSTVLMASFGPWCFPFSFRHKGGTTVKTMDLV